MAYFNDPLTNPYYFDALRQAQQRLQPPPVDNPVINPSNPSPTGVGIAGATPQQAQQQPQTQQPQQTMPQQQTNTNTTGPLTSWQAAMAPAMAVGALTRNPILGGLAGAGLNLLYNYINKKYGS